MKLVLDASIAASWLLKRADPSEFLIADRAIEEAQRHGISVPALWFAELANALLIAERKLIAEPASTERFLADLATLRITPDPANLSGTQKSTLHLARSFSLTAYDATYLELAQRTESTLATFDRKLAEAARAAGVPVFGDHS